MAPSSSESLTSMSATTLAAGVHSGAVRAIDAWQASREAAVSAGEPAEEHRGGSARSDDVGRRRAGKGPEPVDSGNGVAVGAAPVARRNARPVRGAKQLRREKRERRRRNRRSTDVRAFTGLLDSEASAAGRSKCC